MAALRRDGILAVLVLFLVLCHVTKATARQGTVQGRKLLVCNAASLRYCPLCCESVPSGPSLVGTVTSSNSGTSTTQQPLVRTASTNGGTTGTGTSNSVPMDTVQNESQTKPSLVDSSSFRGTFTTRESG
ncbi:hypothetical protein COCOBI_09-2690 [Coccomyxa sp. Obi]|nr:hypothetical protein COCOBI_09-2690 [Coccomyxa sp. Obi]